MKLKRVYIFFTTVLVFFLHLPFAFSKSSKIAYKSAAATINDAANSLVNTTLATKNMLLHVYDSLKLDMKGLDIQAYEEAINGYIKLENNGKIKRKGVITIADFSKSSASKRLFVIDLKSYKVVYHTYVAHGQNSGQEYARSFSNENESLQSSPGFYITSGTYNGINGFSMYLNGMEKGINDKAYDRSIVMHGADYVSENYIRSQGFIGRSWGCPAVSEKLNKPIIERIKNGSVLFIYTKDKNYQRRSRLIQAA